MNAGVQLALADRCARVGGGQRHRRDLIEADAVSLEDRAVAARSVELPGAPIPTRLPLKSATRVMPAFDRATTWTAVENRTEIARKSRCGSVIAGVPVLKAT